MMDEVVLMRCTETLDALNQPVQSWADGPILKCGLDTREGSEMRGNGRLLVRWEAHVRLPIGTIFNPRDRIRVASRLGQPTDVNTVYELVGPAHEGPSGLVVPIRKVQPSA